MLLLPGYVHKVGQRIDSEVGSISKPNGPRFTRPHGMVSDNATAVVDSGKPHRWTKLQFIGGQLARVVMLEDDRLLVGFFFVSGTFTAQNVRTSEDLPEVLLVIGSYVPTTR